MQKPVKITYLGLKGYSARFKTKASDMFFGSKDLMDEFKLMMTIPNWDKDTDWEQENRRELVKGFNAIREKKIADGVKLDCDVEGYGSFRP